MAQQCPTTTESVITGSNIFAQQLFLGASIVNFSSNIGWGGSPSSLSVDLVNDFGSLGDCNITNNPDLDIFQLRNPDRYDALNHYYNCQGDDCYADEYGWEYDSQRQGDPITLNPPPASKERRIPGKVYHVLTNEGLASKYWRKHDPGFFGAGTLIDPNGVLAPRYIQGLGPNNRRLLPYRYNIIGVPVAFRYGYFTFGGIITSWDATINGIPIGVSSYDIFNTAVSYRVQISSADTLLDHCKVVLNDYSGSIFCALNNTIGGPTNYTGPRGVYNGLLRNGNIPNVFNVYGFLESFGFGTSNRNDQGIPLTYELDALTVLTSTAANLGNKHAFSPFGRIIAPIPLTDAISPDDTQYYKNPTNANFRDNSFGILNQSNDVNNVPRIRLALDLSEIPRPPLDIRMNSQNVMSVLDVIRFSCEKTNRDFYTTIVPKGGISFIKVKTINRGVVVPINTIETTVKSVTDSGIPVTQSSFGQTDNRATPRVMLIGANQQRLYQTKSFLLGYSNTHLVYHPVLRQFVDYYRFGKSSTDSVTPEPTEEEQQQEQQQQEESDNYGAEPMAGETSDEAEARAQNSQQSDKTDTKDPITLEISATAKFVDSVRVPLSYSTRNLTLCRLVNGALVTSIWSNEQSLGPNPDSKDSGFSDRPVGGEVVPNIGNYNPAATYKMRSLDDQKKAPKTKAETIKKPTSPGQNYFGVGAAPLPVPMPGETKEQTEERTQRESAKPQIKEKSGKGDAKNRPNPRYLPLYRYSISPFFGYANDLKIPENIGPYTNRFVRPVYFDTVTGQIIVLCRGDELPVLTFGRLFPLFSKRPVALDTLSSQLPSEGLEGEAEGVTEKPTNGTVENDPDAPVQPDPPEPTASATATSRAPIGDIGDLEQFKNILNSGGRAFAFGITESEMRAAMIGVDEYLAYCILKLDFAKPDLFLMLVRGYALSGKQVFRDKPDTPIEEVTGFGENALDSTGESAGKANTGDSAMGAGQTHGNVNNLSFTDALNINFNYLVNYDFYNDLTRIQEFIRALAEKYYGRKYAVSLPALSVYKDKQYSDVQLPAGADVFGVYQGSGKLFYSYDISQDGAWEEFGNTIDDNILVGGPNYFNFLGENNLIKPIIGYNATAIKDYATEAWCELNMEQRDQLIKDAYRLNAPSGIKNEDINSDKACAFIRSSFELSALARYFSCDKSITASLDIGSLSTSEDYIIIPVGDSGREDAFGKRLLGKRQDPCGVQSAVVQIPTEKLYIKTECDADIVFYDPINLRLPKAVINSPGVNLAISSSSFREDPNRTIISNVAAEDLALITYFEKYGSPEYVNKIIGRAADSFNIDRDAEPNAESIEEMKSYGILDSDNDEESEEPKFKTWVELADGLSSKNETVRGKARLRFTKYLLIKMIVPITASKFLIPAPNSSSQSITHYMMAPKKANPVFAAIPLRDNVSCYGPWTNYPILDDRNYTFPQINRIDDLIEQLISDTDIDKQEDWAPWNYGGMSFLDRAILYQIASRTSFQTRAESGEFSIAGSPIFSMGGHLTIKKTDQDINQRVIKTWYSFPYHALNFIPQYAGLSNYAGLTLSDIRLSVGGGNISTSYSFRTYSAKRGIYSKENTDRLKHLSLNAMSVARNISDLRRAIEINIRKQIAAIDEKRRAGGTDKDISEFKSKLFGTSPSTLIVGKAQHYWPLGNFKEKQNTSSSTNSGSTQKSSDVLRREKSRFDAWAGLFKTREALNELLYNYNSQAGMSFDGFYSPVSFYPTAKNGTYSISSRCITDIDAKRNISCHGCGNSRVIKIGEENFPCPLCVGAKLLPASSGNSTDNSSAPVINFLSLNPIVMPTGEFKNPNAQPAVSGERSRHNISFIARDESHIVDRNILINHNLTKYKDNTEDPNPDWTDIDISYKKDNKDNIILNNHRFFALRGPLMLHGWGYDKDGYPVPNAADEPKELDNKGRPKRFFLTKSGTNDLTQDGAFIPTVAKPLGDIIGKGWEKEGGEWIRKPSNKFYLNWAERPDIWPIGPVDLRWDYEKKIWVGGGEGGCANADPPYIITSGTSVNILSQFIGQTKSGSDSKCSYKMVYGVLEQDLIKIENHIETQPTRAFLDDLEYGLKPLPQNIRRLIYIVDRTGYTAPRGAKLLLRYNVDTGFYEPVSKQQYIVFGIINNNGSAVVELNYMPGYKSGDSTYKTTIQYVNPLNLQISSTNSIGANSTRRGIFMYDNSQWNLIAIG